MKKSTLIMVLSLVLSLALAAGGTLAYLTDEDGDINVMTVGNVQIVQNEQQRVDQTVANSELEEFEQNKNMMPAVFKGDTEKLAQNVNGWDIVIRNEDTVRNYVDKIVTVSNQGNSDAYVRTLLAFPTKGYDSGELAFDEWLHWNYVSDTDTTPNNGWMWGTKENGVEYPNNTKDWNAFYDVEIKGEMYTVYIATNVDVLPAKTTTAPTLVGMYLDAAVDNELKEDGTINYYVTKNGQKFDLGDISKLEILTLSQAVQADGFDSAWEAFDAAFPITDADAIVNWMSNIEVGSPDGNKNDTNNPPVFSTIVYSEDELNDALGKYGDITLGADIATEFVNVEKYVNADIDLNEKTLTGDIVNYGNVTISGGQLESATAGIENYGDATFVDIEMKAGSPTDYAAISYPGSETVYENVNLVSAGGGVAAVDGAQVTFTSGSVAVNTASTSGRYLFYLEGEGSVVTIEGGEFSFSKTLNQKRAYIYAGEGTTVYVKGGNFGPASTRSGYTAGILGTGEVIITGGTFGFDPSDWVAEDYQAVKTGSTWTVSPIN